MSIEDVIERIRATAGAEFAFVLTMRGRLVTQHAPKDMPQVGRERIVSLAQSIREPRQIERVTLPRDALVPFGGAAPIDVYFGVAADRAIVCAVVIAGWRQVNRIKLAIAGGLEELEPKLKSAFDSQVISRGRLELPPTTRKEPSPASSTLGSSATTLPAKVPIAQESSALTASTSKRRLDHGALTVKASPRARDLGPASKPASVHVPPESVARSVAPGDLSREGDVALTWIEPALVEELEVDAHEAHEGAAPASAPLPPTARRESFPPPSDLDQPTQRIISPQISIQLEEADGEELKELVRQEKNEKATTGRSGTRKKEGGDLTPATQRVPGARPTKPTS